MTTQLSTTEVLRQPSLYVKAIVAGVGTAAATLGGLLTDGFQSADAIAALAAGVVVFSGVFATPNSVTKEPDDDSGAI